MGTGRYPDGADDAADTSEERTLADEEWPVAEQYRVEPVAEPAGEPLEDDGTVVVRQEQPAEPAPVIRRFPPDLGPGLLAALIGVLLLLLLIPGGLWLAGRFDDDSQASGDSEAPVTPTAPTTTEPPRTTAPSAPPVPDVTGLRLPEARELLESANLRARVSRVDSDRPPNEVVSQDPAAGADPEPRSKVLLVVSGATGRVVVPDVEGEPAGEATASLLDADLRVRTRLVPSDEPEGTVVDQTPAAGAEVTRRTTVAVQIAKPRATPPPPTEPTTIRVPNLVGMRAADARSRLQGLGLRPTQRPVESERAAGEVVSHSPGAGARLREGATVSLRVSTGPPSVAVPDVVGFTEAAAMRDLEAAGFVVRVVDEPTIEPTEDGTVLQQAPPAGTTQRKGTTVTITVARFS
jgi:beta-lactam-binding protein with PASTA domain